MSYKVKNDQVPFEVFFKKGTVTDAEGEVLDEALITRSFGSSDTGVLNPTLLGTVTKEEAEALGDPSLEGADRYEVTVGTSGSATLEAKVMGATGGDPLAFDSETFLVTKGDPANVQGLDIVIPGLTPEP